MREEKPLDKILLHVFIEWVDRKPETKGDLIFIENLPSGVVKIFKNLTPDINL